MSIVCLLFVCDSFSHSHNEKNVFFSREKRKILVRHWYYLEYVFLFSLDFFLADFQRIISTDTTVIFYARQSEQMVAIFLLINIDSWDLTVGQTNKMTTETPYWLAFICWPILTLVLFGMVLMKWGYLTPEITFSILL